MKPTLESWLDQVVCSEPFTLDDARELRRMIKEWAGVTGAEVYYTKGRDAQKVHVAVDVGGQRIKRSYDVR